MTWTMLIIALLQPDSYAVAYNNDGSWGIVDCSMADQYGYCPPFNLAYQQHRKFGSDERDYLQVVPPADAGQFYRDQYDDGDRIYTCVSYCPSYEKLLHKTWLSELVRWRLGGRAYIQWDASL